MAGECDHRNCVVIRSKTHPNLVLDGTHSNARLRPKNGSPGQMWKPIAVDMGRFLFANHLNEGVLCIPQGADVGCEVEVSQMTRRIYQQWWVKSDGTILNGFREFALELSEATIHGATLKVAQKSGLTNQQFLFASILTNGNTWWYP